MTDKELELLLEEVAGRGDIAERWDYLRKNNREAYEKLRDIHDRRMQELDSLSSPWMEYVKIRSAPGELVGADELKELLRRAKDWREEWRQIPHEEKVRRRRRIRRLQVLKKKSEQEAGKAAGEAERAADEEALAAMERRVEWMITELESLIRGREASAKERSRVIRHFQA